MKLDDIQQVKDVALERITAESKRREARKAMKVARIEIMVELNRWDKLLMKYEALMKKEGSLSHATRTLVESLARSPSAATCP